ncbi:hypothetical protein V2J09_014446 [Rumex salicifolius]
MRIRSEKVDQKLFDTLRSFALSRLENQREKSERDANAPVTRGFVVASALFTVFFGIQGRSNKLGLSYQVAIVQGPPSNCGSLGLVMRNPDIFQKLQLWKFIVSIFAFSSTPELLFGLYLLYYFRVFERQIGSNKYSVFILFSVAVSLLLELVSLAVLKDPSFNLITSGPYGLIFASFVPFFFDIPVSTRFRVFGFRFSDKSFIYLAGLQFPGFIASIFSRFSFPSTGSSSSTPAARNILGGAPPYGARQVEATYLNSSQRSYPSPAVGAIEPLEDSVATLVAMGFERSSARQALEASTADANLALFPRWSKDTACVHACSCKLEIDLRLYTLVGTFVNQDIYTCKKRKQRHSLAEEQHSILESGDIQTAFMELKCRGYPTTAAALEAGPAETTQPSIALCATQVTLRCAFFHCQKQ